MAKCHIVANKMIALFQMRVTLGDHNLYKLDSSEIQVRVSHIEVHPEFTNVANLYGVKDYDIALLDFGEDKEILPIFSKYIRPICMGSSLNSSGMFIEDLM